MRVWLFQRLGVCGGPARPGKPLVVTRRPLSFRLGTVWPCVPGPRLGLRGELGNFPGPRKKDEPDPVWCLFPRRGRGMAEGFWGGAMAVSGTGGQRGGDVRGKGSRGLRRPPLPLHRLVFTPRLLGPGAQKSRGTKGREKKTLAGGGML